MLQDTPNPVVDATTIRLTNLKATGVISYTLTAGEFTATRKMVVVR